jgi:putative transposase
VKANQAQHSVKRTCEVLGISRSGYYAWLERPPSTRAERDEKLRARVRAIHGKSKKTYGSPRIHAELREDGEHVSRKRVARIMREEKIQGVSRRRGYTVTTRPGDEKPATDLVERNFVASGPNELWVADITYVPTWSGFMYLAVVLDVWSRRVVGWAMESHLRTELVLEALEMAVEQRRPDGVVHHSDHGCQYTSVAFSDRCEAAGIFRSMGTVGDAYDNAMCESFFATM